MDGDHPHRTLRGAYQLPDAARRPDRGASRGALVRDFLLGTVSAGRYVQEVALRGAEYSGFNLLAGDRDGVHYVSNRGGEPRALDAGIYGMSNPAPLD